MKLSQESPQSKFYIRSYEAGSIIINDEDYSNSLIITPEKIISWRPNTFNDLKKEDFTIILESKPQILLLGTGIKQHFPNPALLAELYNVNIGVEIMDTGAACRTFNLLLAENRNVVAALIIK